MNTGTLRNRLVLHAPHSLIMLRDCNPGICDPGIPAVFTETRSQDYKFLNPGIAVTNYADKSEVLLLL